LELRQAVLGLFMQGSHRLREGRIPLLAQGPDGDVTRIGSGLVVHHLIVTVDGFSIKGPTARTHLDARRSLEGRLDGSLPE